MPNDEPMSLDMAQTDNIEFFSWAETESGRLVIGSRNRLLIYEDRVKIFRQKRLKISSFNLMINMLELKKMIIKGNNF